MKPRKLGKKILNKTLILVKGRGGAVAIPITTRNMRKKLCAMFRNGFVEAIYARSVRLFAMIATTLPDSQISRSEDAQASGKVVMNRLLRVH